MASWDSSARIKPGTRTGRGAKLAPAGRVIRPSRPRTLPTEPANSDIPRRVLRVHRSFKSTRLGQGAAGVILGVAVAYSLHSTGPVVSNSIHHHVQEQLAKSLANAVTPVSLNSPSEPIALQQSSTDATLGATLSALNLSADSLMAREVEPVAVAGSGVKQTRSRLGAFSVPAKDIPANGAEVSTVEHARPLKGLDRVTAKVHSIVKKYAPKHKNPAVLAEAIVKECAAQGYDPLFVAAVIKSESTFNSAARSNKGAQGLMQIMPATGAWLTKRESLPHGKLTDPGHNLKLGITYLRQLEEQFKGNRVFTLVAYNWGPGHLERASVGKNKIPAESMTYAVNILNDYRRWKAGVI